MAATKAISTEHIEITPGVCGGKPRIAGTRIRVQDVVIWHEEGGRSPDEIVSQYPHLALADVYAALAYYYDRRDEIRRQIDEDDAFVREEMAKSESVLKKSVGYGRDPDNSVSS
jgi:uncharacterized protein (DUF433 family)